jgi:hypothetical protein
MPKWDIDNLLRKLEPEYGAGTSLERVVMDFEVLKKEGLKPTEAQLKRGTANVWCLGLGFLGMPKAFFYGQTIRQAFLRARKAAKANKLAEYTPWGTQPFKPKPKDRKKRKHESLHRKPAQTD